ncbi:MAG: hypothetical protein R3E58_16435 [Phycisphaerae bacterium]
MMKRGSDPPEVTDIHRTIEETLGVHIDDESAEKLESPRELAEFVGDRVSCAQVEQVPCLTAKAFYEFRRSLQKIEPKLAGKLRPDTDLESLVPKDERQRFWERLNGLGYELPELHYSGLATMGFLIGPLYAACAIVFLIGRLWPEPIALSTARNLLLILILPALITTVVGLTRIKRRQIPRPLNTLRGMATYLAYRHCEPSWLGRLSKRQVKEVVLLACTLEIGMPIKKP